jgi:predicted nucleic acid-binding protein
MIAPVFVDSNVFVCARDASDALKQKRAAGWLAYLWRERAGRISTQVLSEYYVTVTRKLDPGLPAHEAWDDVQALLSWRPYPVDAAVLARGREVELRYKLSWWDSLIVAAAQLQGCAVLLSEDMQDGAGYGDVTVRSPFRLAVQEEVPMYLARPAAPRTHPSRGRPKGSGRKRSIAPVG